MKNEFRDIDDAMSFFNDIGSTEYYIYTFESIEEYMQDKGLDIKNKDDAIECNNAIIFFKKNPNSTVYELSSNANGESELTTNIEDVYYFINNIN
jgi:hypothetical protein